MTEPGWRFGRLAGLAVALGIGAAVGAGCGAAWASDPDSEHTGSSAAAGGTGPASRSLAPGDRATHVRPTAVDKRGRQGAKPFAARASSPPVTASAEPAASAFATSAAKATRGSLLSTLLTKIRSTFFNKSPTVAFRSSGSVVHPDGTITGTLIASDADGDPLRYSAGRTMNGGTVAIDTDGIFTYTPGDGFAQSAGTDLFTVTVAEANAGRHLHGPFGFLLPGRGATASTIVTVDDSTTAAAAGDWGPATVMTNFTGASALGGWYVYDGAGNAGYGTRTPSALSFANNLLTITGDSHGNTGGLAWWPGQTYGGWEVRVKAPPGAENYDPVVLLWPDAENWPEGGEVDFMEIIKHPARQLVTAALHYSAGNQWVSAGVPVDATGWHNYAVAWTPRTITAFVDGMPFFSSTDVATFPPGAMHLAVQLDSVAADVGEGATMQVAWARRYALAGVAG